MSWLAVLLLLAPTATARAGLFGPSLDRTNRRLRGTIIDYTHNHGSDRRLWSPSLQEKRDLYVYLPPGYDPCKRYPTLLWLHGFAQDEQSFLTQVAPAIDAAIACGNMPPLIVAAPDGSLKSRSTVFFLNAGSFYLNTKAGNFEDYLIQDVWSFLVTHYPVRPEREAHVLAGVSMGGGAAYNLAIKNRDCFGVVLGMFPPLNTRWMDAHGNYMANFDPNNWGWRTQTGLGFGVVGRFFGVVTIRLKHVIGPLYGFGPNAVAAMSRENPIEMLDTFDVRDGQLAMYVGYGGKDQFNIDAQVESFVYHAHERGIGITVGYEPKGKHDLATAYQLFPSAVEWLGPLLAPYAP